ncbi:hypothetical protein ASG25_10390 [Rhizobium sp. Leaf384]|nr:hypothetical protein ASG25_10390 [Rhizobium sp. Leaf384]KQS82634.1 hypothetical protein ASG58_04590 [Rhizobium sp. Leaf383]
MDVVDVNGHDPKRVIGLCDAQKGTGWGSLSFAANNDPVPIVTTSRISNLTSGTLAIRALHLEIVASRST